MVRWQVVGKTSQALIALGIFLLLVPLFLSLVWGTYFSDGAFETFQAAQALTGDMQLVYAAGTLTQSALYVGLLAAAGVYAPQIALVIGALGWGVTAVVILLALRAAGRPLAGIIAALLLVINPLVITTAGTETSWVLAIGWAATALTIFPAARLRTAMWLKWVLLFLLLGLHFNAATILFVLALLAMDVYRGHARWLPFLLAAGAALLWALVMTPRYGNPPAADAALWLQRAAHFAAREQLTWLFVPFILAGAWDVWTWARPGSKEPQSNAHGMLAAPATTRSFTDGQQFVAFILLWLVAAVCARDVIAPALAVVTALTLAALGAAWIVRRLLASDRPLDDQWAARLLVPVLVLAPLIAVSAINQWKLYTGIRHGLVLQAELQDRAAQWLQEQGAPEAKLFAVPRIGYTSGMVAIPALTSAIRDENVDAVYDRLLGNVPDYIVSDHAPAWDYITRTRWFQDRYQAAVRFRNDYAADSPVTIWRHTPSAYDAGDRETLRAVVDDRFALVGYQFAPQVVTPGEDIYVTLYLEAIEPVTSGFITGVHLTTPDGWVWAWQEERTPRTISGERWGEGLVIPERIHIPTAADIPLGAYDLQVFWRDGDSKDKLPIVRDGDDNLFDRVFLGTVLAPPPVDASQAAPVKAYFGDAIVLDGYELSTPMPGEPLDVTLYWQAASRPVDDYTVFVHLLDAGGQIVAAHDGMPVDSLFPTSTWKPGQVIGDKHSLALPAEMPAGPYQVKVGLYLLQTGERLPVRDSSGSEQADRSMPLATITIGETSSGQ